MKRAISIGLVCLLVIATAGMAAGADLEHGDERAVLDIAQPAFIDSPVDIDRQDNRTVYAVSGPEHRILIEDEDHADVVDFGILEGSGSLEYDDARDEFVLSASGEEGTRVIFFDVQREVEREVQQGNETVTETRTETVRQVATIQISDVDWKHATTEEFSELENDAANWSAVATQAKRLDPDRPPEDTISSSFRLFKFVDELGKPFFADAQAAVIILTSRPGGLAILGLLISSLLAASYAGMKVAARRERQFAEIEDLDEMRRDAYLQHARQVLSEADWNAIFPEHHARALRDLLGEDVWLGFKRYMLIRSPTAVKGTLLQAMGIAGYTARTRRNDQGVPVEAKITPPDDEDGPRAAADGGLPTPVRGWEPVNLATLDYDDPDDRAIIDATPGDALEPEVFGTADIGFEDVRFPITNRQVEDADLVDELDPRFPGDFEDEEEMAEVLASMLMYVVSHDHTDELGQSRREMDLLSFMAEMDSVLCDRADFPVWHIERRVLLWIADNLDPGEELQDRLDAIEADGVEEDRS